MPNSSSNANTDGQLTIDLGALQKNYQTLQDHAPSAETAAVVKADGYGIGAVQAAKALVKAGARKLFVAQVAEGVEVRQALASVKDEVEIFVFRGLAPGDEEMLAKHKLIPCLNSHLQIDLWEAFGKANGAQPAAIQVDTGMNRLGLEDQQVKNLATHKHRLQGIEIKLFMSHLACGDEPDHPQNQSQLDRFKSYRALFPEVPASLANSAGILLGQDYHFDLTRPGIALYGGNPIPERPNPVKPVVSLEVKVVQVRPVAQGEAIGYSATHVTKRPSRIAILSLGYADGLLRSLSGSGYLIINGQKVPYLGRVSMDLIAVDVTDIPVDDVREGDSVPIFGDKPDLNDLALCAKTISYELLTSLGHRYQRTYVGG